MATQTWQKQRRNKKKKKKRGDAWVNGEGIRALNASVCDKGVRAYNNVIPTALMTVLLCLTIERSIGSSLHLLFSLASLLFLTFIGMGDALADEKETK